MSVTYPNYKDPPQSIWEEFKFDKQFIVGRYLENHQTNEINQNYFKELNFNLEDNDKLINENIYENADEYLNGVEFLHDDYSNLFNFEDYFT